MCRATGAKIKCQGYLTVSNQLYPVFLKLDQLKVLIVGGGSIVIEKIHSIFESSPNANVTVQAQQMSEELHFLLKGHSIKYQIKAFKANDVKNYSIVIAATEDPALNCMVYRAAKAHNCLVNVADTPTFCDFFLGAIVNKGNLKIAISTNGQSPTVAKRLKQLFQDIIPIEINSLINNLNIIRKQLKTNFATKVKHLNQLTESLVS